MVPMGISRSLRTERFQRAEHSVCALHKLLCANRSEDMKVSVSFSEDELKAHIKSAVAAWGCTAEIGYVSISYNNSSGDLSATVMLRLQNRNPSLRLNKEQVQQAVAVGASRKGTPIDPASLKFTYNERSGHCGSSHTTATATAGAVELAGVEKALGKVTFPGTATQFLGMDEVEKLVRSAATRAGLKPRHVSLSYDKVETCPSATIHLDTPGSSQTVHLATEELQTTLRDELNAKGYDVPEGGVTAKYTPGRGFGGGSTVTADVLTRVFPMG